MFNDLEEVARHLQRNGIKIDTPNDPKMAEVLGKYGVLNGPIGKSKNCSVKISYTRRIIMTNHLRKLIHDLPFFSFCKLRHQQGQW